MRSVSAPLAVITIIGASLARRMRRRTSKPWASGRSTSTMTRSVPAASRTAIDVWTVFRQLARFLPLVALLRFSLAFPDHTPSRARLSLRAGSIRRLEERVSELRERGEQADIASAAENVVVIAAGLSVHDRKTRGHSERVRALSELIAAQLHLDDTERDRLRWASLLHDCGKVCVDAKI